MARASRNGSPRTSLGPGTIGDRLSSLNLVIGFFAVLAAIVFNTRQRMSAPIIRTFAASFSNTYNTANRRLEGTSIMLVFVALSVTVTFRYALFMSYPPRGRTMAISGLYQYG